MEESSSVRGAIMTSADAMRASDSDRERVVQALQEQVGEGRLTLAEFEERSGIAYDAKTVGELRVLTEDLPIDPLAPQANGLPWQQPYPMPDLPPWAQRTFPTAQQRSLPPARRGSPIGVAAVLLVALLVVQGVLAVTAGVFFFPLPLLFILFFVLRPGRRFH
jgi:hypothetical protein